MSLVNQVALLVMLFFKSSPLLLFQALHSFFFLNPCSLPPFLQNLIATLPTMQLRHWVTSLGQFIRLHAASSLTTINFLLLFHMSSSTPQKMCYPLHVTTEMWKISCKVKEKITPYLWHSAPSPPYFFMVSKCEIYALPRFCVSGTNLPLYLPPTMHCVAFYGCMLCDSTTVSDDATWWLITVCKLNWLLAINLIIQQWKSEQQLKTKVTSYHRQTCTLIPTLGLLGTS